MTKEIKSKSDKKSLIIRIIAIILLVAGIVLIFNKPIGDWMIRQNQQSTLSSLTKKKVEANKKKKGMFDFSKVKDMDAAKATKTRLKNTANAIGALAIPDVNMYLPIMLGLSDDSLSTGGGTMRANQTMGKGNYPLAGHYMTSNGILFSPLENTQLGQKVYLTDLKHIYIYRIYMKKKVDPHAVYLVRNTKKAIVTLITCADGGVNRWAVRGKLIDTEKATNKNLQVFKLNS